jgi:hypothetical protein
MIKVVLISNAKFALKLKKKCLRRRNLRAIIDWLKHLISESCQVRCEKSYLSFTFPCCLLHKT